jgi:transcriptional regulator with XRE-family HTH domain
MTAVQDGSGGPRDALRARMARRTRADQGLGLDQIDRELGLPAGTWSDFEDGVDAPSPDVLGHLASIFHHVPSIVLRDFGYADEAEAAKLHPIAAAEEYRIKVASQERGVRIRDRGSRPVDW